MGYCIVVGAGDCPSISIGPKKEDYVIAADAGLLSCLENDIIPDLCIGDFDSMELSQERRDLLQEHKTELVILPTEKDDTDLLAAIRIGLQKGYRDFVIFGALGGARISHSIANIQLLLFLQKEGASGSLIREPETEDEPETILFLLEKGTTELSGQKGDLISLFAIGSDVLGVSIEGLKYEVSNTVISPSFPIGVSNEFVGMDARITIGEGKLLVVEEIFSCERS